MLTPEVVWFQQLSWVERREFLGQLQSAIEGAGWDEALMRRARGLVGHLATLTQDAFTYVEEQQMKLHELPQNHYGLPTIKSDLADYPMVGANQRESIKNRMAKGLWNKPPEAKKDKPKTASELAGRFFEFDEDLAP